MSEYRDMIEAFATLLAAKAKERDNHQTFVAHPLGVMYGHTVPEWHLNEMKALLERINQLRKEKHLEPISLEKLIRAEVHACGHVDYAQKLAIYCTELTLFGELKRPV
jgi:hypothetical protein